MRRLLMESKSVGKWNRTRAWVLSLVVNTAIFVLISQTTHLYYETNDDFAIAQELVAGYPYVGFANYYLCKALVYIQNIFTHWNIFVISQMFFSFIAFTVILKIFLQRKESLADIVIPILACSFFALDHYCSIQFTKTAALLMLCGMLWLADNYIHERKALAFLMALIIFYIGTAYRQKGMFPELAFAGSFMIIWLLLNCRDYYKGKKPVREIALILILVVATLGAYAFDKASDAANASTPEMKYAREFQKERTKITDYPVLKYYEQNREEYDSIGIDVNDLSLINKWVFDYDGAATLDNLKKINGINRPYVESSHSVTKAIKQALKTSFGFLINYKGDLNGMHYILIMAIIVYILLNNKPKTYIYVAALLAVAGVVYVSVFYLQRVLYRALYIADISAAFWLLYASLIGESYKAKIPRWIAAALGVVVIALLANPALARMNRAYEHNKEVLVPEKILEYLDKNNKNFYIGPTGTIGQPKSYMNPLGMPSGPDNVSGTGGWETLSPYKLDYLGKYGIKNPVRDLIDNEKAFFLGSQKIDSITEYYNKWCCGDGETVEFQKVDEVDGKGIYKVVKKKSE